MDTKKARRGLSRLLNEREITLSWLLKVQIKTSRLGKKRVLAIRGYGRRGSRVFADV